MPSALLMIDMQNGFLHPKGTCSTRGLEVPDRAGIVERCAALLDAARGSALPVLYAQHCHRPDLSDIAPAVRRRYPDGVRPLLRGSWDGAIVAPLTPHHGETVVVKNRYDAFLRTDLEHTLHRMGVDHLLVAGVLTDMCVETTVRSADQRNFRVTVAADCVAAADTIRHERSLAAMSTAFADVLPWTAALARATQPAPCEAL